MTTARICARDDCPAALQKRPAESTGQFAGRKFCSRACSRAGQRRVGKQPQTHCKRGHELTPDNTRIGGGRRGCRQCQRDRDAARTGSRNNRARRPRSSLPPVKPPPPIPAAPTSTGDRPVWRPNAPGWGPIPGGAR